MEGEGPPATFTWRQVDGPDVASSLSGAGTDTLRFRTLPLLALVPEPQHTGVIAVPAAGIGRYTFEVTATRGDESARGLVTVQSAFASTGTRGVAVDTDVILAGPANQTAWLWSLEGRAYDAEIVATLSGADTRFPVVRLLVKDDLTAREELSGTEIKLYGGTWDGFEPCGRCHEPEQDGWQGSLHATVLNRGLRGLLGHGYREECLACHALGWQPGVENGGFDDVARRLGWRFPTELGSDAAALPPDLERLGGVECISCHGPGRFTPARFDTGMCSACHDLPPRYTQVLEWRQSPMARLPSPLPDDHPALRRPCTRCHATQGFVRWSKGAKVPDPPLPSDAEPIACAACHDPHDGRRPHQLRYFDHLAIGGMPETHLGAGAVCAACHMLERDGITDPLRIDPHTPQADVLVGTIPGLDNERSPHAGVPGTCVACHRPHAFAATAACDQRECAACHEGPCDGSLRREVDAELAALDGALATELSQTPVRCDGAHPTGVTSHEGRLTLVGANGAALPGCDLSSPSPETASLLRAGLLLALVRRDGSHGAHNPEWTRMALRAARAAIGGGGR